MKRLVLASIAVAGLGACTDQPMTPAQLLAAQALVTVVGATVPDAAQALEIGQLLCNTATGAEAVFDAKNNAPYLVTGKPAQTVANVCAAIGGQPVPPPGSKLTVPAVKVVIPTA